jgi:hypothetical protein
MLLYRSLTLGLLGAILVLVATPPIGGQRSIVERPVVQHDVTVIDVAPRIDPTTLLSLIRLGEDERIVAVDERQVASDLAAGAAIAAAHRRGKPRFIDLAVASPGRESRRVLVLLH